MLRLYCVPAWADSYWEQQSLAVLHSSKQSFFPVWVFLSEAQYNKSYAQILLCSIKVDSYWEKRTLAVLHSFKQSLFPVWVFLSEAQYNISYAQIVLCSIKADSYCKWRLLTVLRMFHYLSVLLLIFVGEPRISVLESFVLHTLETKWAGESFYVGAIKCRNCIFRSFGIENTVTERQERNIWRETIQQNDTQQNGCHDCSVILYGLAFWMSFCQMSFLWMLLSWISFFSK